MVFQLWIGATTVGISISILFLQEPMISFGGAITSIILLFLGLEQVVSAQLLYEHAKARRTFLGVLIIISSIITILLIPVKSAQGELLVALSLGALGYSSIISATYSGNRMNSLSSAMGARFWNISSGVVGILFAIAISFSGMGNQSASIIIIPIMLSGINILVISLSRSHPNVRTSKGVPSF